MTSILNITLNDGNQIPVLGLGTSGCSPDDLIGTVKDAIDIGYRHFDCAYIYGNEKDLGVGLAAKIIEGVVKREDLFITTKLWNTHHRPAIVETALINSLKNLGLDYIDLYLIHWPMGYKEEDNWTTSFSEYDYVDTWKAMEEIKKKGLAKSIGVSNFNKQQLERVLKHGKIPPSVNQIECHPYLNQQKLIDFCKLKNVQVVAYSPFVSPGRFSSVLNYSKIFDNDKINEIANKLKKTPAQIILRWLIQRDVVVIPKSVHKKRIQENCEVFNFKLAPEDISVMDGLNINSRFMCLKSSMTHKFYPFHDDY
ncbi:hypothetical protein FQR65_LT08485 [Abscondita terminalis]|nr:hypothetical protein FQR65_LT08485 [Abscondita terminalis]